MCHYSHFIGINDEELLDSTKFNTTIIILNDGSLQQVIIFVGLISSAEISLQTLVSSH